MGDIIKWLEEWYLQQCHGTWEHEHGVSIESLDNPGWRVRIELLGTQLEDACSDKVLSVVGDPPGPHNKNIGSATWMHCEIRNRVFTGAGDGRALHSIIEYFRDWAASVAP